jgi:outer membrane protein
MKNLNYIISGILGAAVVVLFILQFSSKPEETVEKAVAKAESVISAESLNIAFFNMDSVLANWEFYMDIQDKLSSKQQQLESDMETRSQDFMKRVEDAQYKIQRGLVTRAEAEQLQQQLASEEQNLMGLQSNYASQLQEEGVVKNRQMIDNIEQYLKQYNKDKGYSFIFSYSFGGNLMYGAEGHNITREIIAGINKAYPAEKK